MRIRGLKALLASLACVAACATAWAQRVGGPQEAPLVGPWLSVGLGGAAVTSTVPAPSAGRGAMAASLDFGYRFTPQWGLGLDLGAVLPLRGCADWDCAGTAAQFAPDFTRIHLFSEYRPRNEGWRFRAGLGVSRFCYRSQWSDTAWSWTDAVNAFLEAFDGDSQGTIEGSGNYRCGARKNALGGMVSVGYDWPVAAEAPVTMGVRLTAEAAGFHDTPAIGLPAFRHRSVMLTLHLNLN
jgi:hypothetical protein